MATDTAREVMADVVTLLRIEPGGLDHYLKMVGEGGGNPRFKCYDGSLLLVSQSYPHAISAERIAVLIRSISSALKIRCHPLGSTTLRVSGEDKGMEPDKAFYVQNFEAVKGHKQIDLAVVPPPDLVVEVVVTNPPTRSLAFCRDVGVPEVWVYNLAKQRLDFLVLEHSGKKPAEYRRSETSLAFPFMTPGDVVPWLSLEEEDAGTFDRKLRKWVRAELAPRVSEAGKRPKPDL